MSFRPWHLFVQTCVIFACAGCSDAEVAEPPGGGGTGGTGAPAGGKGGGAGSGTGGGAAGTSAGTTGSAGKGASGAAGSGTGGGAGQAGAGSGAGGMSGGAAGTSGSAGSAAGGSGGGQVGGNCKFSITGSTSKAIPTVGIVEWTTDLPNVTEARVEFTLDDAAAEELNKGSGGPIEVGAAMNRALLLGLKAGRSYTYRIVATAGATVCTSEDQSLTTGALANGLPTIQRRVENAAAIDPGFIVTSSGFSVGMGGGGMQFAYIFDADGDIVWWASSPPSCSRALMSYEGTDMWMLELNVDNQGGEMRRVSMDGLDVEMNVEGLSRVHHDFTVLPGGVVAGPSWVSTGRDPPSDLIERSPDGTIDVVVTIDERVYQANTYHTNAIVYYPDTDTYTLGDRNPNAFVKITRTGEVLWQFGGSCSGSPAQRCAEGDWQVNHGHHLLSNGNFVFFNNGAGMNSLSTAYEYSLTENGNSLTANMVWSYSSQGVSSMVLGDVQRLPNGNTIVVYSNAGDIHEVDPQGEFVQAFETESLGYANFRKSLYGPPLR